MAFNPFCKELSQHQSTRAGEVGISGGGSGFLCA